MNAVVARAVELDERDSENQATRIANAIVPPLAKILNRALSAH